MDSHDQAKKLQKELLRYVEGKWAGDPAIVELLLETHLAIAEQRGYGVGLHDGFQLIVRPKLTGENDAHSKIPN